MTLFTAPRPRPARVLLLPYLLTALIAVGILWGTLSPPGDGTGALPLTDKQLHALAWGLLILPMALVAPRRALRLAPACVAFGALIEVIQPHFGRGAEWADLGADALGVACGLLLGFALRRLLRRH